MRDILRDRPETDEKSQSRDLSGTGTWTRKASCTQSVESDFSICYLQNVHGYVLCLGWPVGYSSSRGEQGEKTNKQ